MKLKTSNKDKIKEYLSFLPSLEIVEGSDDKEVLGTVDEVILHKSKNNPGYVVEDTILIVNGVPKVDIKFNINEVRQGDNLEWVTSIAYNDGDTIKVARGTIEGTADLTRGTEGFGFDFYFVPKKKPYVKLEKLLQTDITGLTLAELDKLKLKDVFSARGLALNNFIFQHYVLDVDVNSIKEWKGEYQ